MKTARTLRLRREELTELGGDDLAAVVGGSHLCNNITDPCTHGASLEAACPTLPVNPCLSLNQNCTFLCPN
jgi:hypothetical protein